MQHARVLVLLVVCALATALRAEAAAALPDWSGAWGGWAEAHGLLRSTEEENTRPPFKDPAVAERFFAEQKRVNAGGSQIFACRTPGSPRFAGRTAGPPTTMVEFLFTPGRVTVLTSNGLVRRIYTGGQKLPDDGYVTATGTSRGRWEGQTLVVHTTGLGSDAVLPGIGKAGAGFRVDERIRLTAKDRLEIDAVIIAPELFTKPYRLPPQVFQRHPYRHEAMQEYLSECAPVDRAVDAKTGQQTFDFTPPSDLPPPPKD